MMLSSFHHCFSRSAFIVYGLVFQVHELHSARLTVVGSPGPVTVASGENAVLPCRFSPAQSAQDMEVTWFREQLSPFVHRYKEGQDQYQDQMLQYQGRTELWKDGLAKGTVNLKIFNIQLSDRGNYICSVRSGSDYDEAVVELKVAARGSAPLVVLEQYQDGGIRVSCHSAGWYPRPQVLWRDPHGQHLPSLSESVTQDQSSLFAVESSIILTRGTKQNFSCWVRHVLDGQERGSAFYISDPFFHNAHPWKIALGVFMVAVVGLLIISAYLFKIKGKHEEQIGNRDAEIARREAALRDRDAEIEKQAQELAWIRNAVRIKKVKVILDSHTAHRSLVLSDDCKSVRRQEKALKVFDLPRLYKPQYCVLGREGFTSGRCYWEVEVMDGEHWTVGVCTEDVKKNSEIKLKPEEDFWAVGRWKGYFQALTSDHTVLSEILAPKRIRVSLDYEEGLVSFFSVDENIPIFMFPPTSFEGKTVYPWFWLGSGTWLRVWP